MDDLNPFILALLFSLKTDLSVCSFYGTVCSGMPAVLGPVKCGASFPVGSPCFCGFKTVPCYYCCRILCGFSL